MNRVIMNCVIKRFRCTLKSDTERDKVGIWWKFRNNFPYFSLKPYVVVVLIRITNHQGNPNEFYWVPTTYGFMEKCTKLFFNII